MQSRYCRMLSLRNSLYSLLTTCAMALAGGGCHAPWSVGDGSLSRESDTAAAAAATVNSPPRAGSTTDSPVMPPVAPLPQVVSEPDMAAVMDKLQQVGEIDPSAQQKLMEELERTDPKFWPAAAEQFRASLAYHEELAARRRRTRPGGDTSAESRIDRAVGSADFGELGRAEASPSPMATNRPSTPIGALLDPRHADADGVSSEALAQATPYSRAFPVGPPDSALPPTDGVVPAKFVSDGTAQPIAADRLPASSEATPPVAKSSVYAQVPAVVNAGFETVVGADDVSPSNSAAPESASPPDWQQLVTQAADDLSKRVAESPATTAEIHQHVSLRILRLLAGQTEGALEPIPHISPVEQDYWSRQLFALATYLDHHSQPDDKRRAAASVAHLDDAVSNLRELGALSLRNLTFCKNIYGYGAVEPYKEDRFAAGEQVSLYVEVENYHSESTEKGFTTSLGSTYELVDEKGQRVDGGEFPAVEDCCRTRRRDFHIQFGLALPEKIAPGRYQFKLVVRDRRSDKIANATAAFEIREKQVGQ